MQAVLSHYAFGRRGYENLQPDVMSGRIDQCLLLSFSAIGFERNLVVSPGRRFLSRCPLHRARAAEIARARDWRATKLVRNYPS
jgi:hypothetical protein